MALERTKQALASDSHSEQARNCKMLTCNVMLQETRQWTKRLVCTAPDLCFWIKSKEPSL